MDKFGRNYKLAVGREDGSLQSITLPFTLEFDIIRNTLTSANVCQIRIYNLAEPNRNQLRFNVSNYGEWRPVVLQAGYGNSLATVFTGNVTQAWSVREGVNFMTYIEAHDAGFAFVNAQTNLQFPAGTPQQTVIATLIGSLPHVSLGAVGSYPGVLSRGNSYSGSTVDVLRSLTGGGFFVDNGKGHALGTNEYIANDIDVTVINSSSGLLGTPVLEETIVHFDIVFEPRLMVGQAVSLQSATAKNLNGLFKVTGVKHRGMISAAVCGSVITTGEFLNVSVDSAGVFSP